MTKRRVLVVSLVAAIAVLAVFLWALSRVTSEGLSAGPSVGLEAVAPGEKRVVPVAPAPPLGAPSLGKPAEGGEGLLPLPSGAWLSNQMIVYITSMTLVVKDVEQGVASVEAVVEWAGGFIANSNIREEGRHKVATVTLRVPASRYGEVMTRLRQLALEVKGENANARDVGEEYADLDAQVKNLEATEARYIQLLQRANTIDEILRVQQRVSEVRDRIDRIRGRMNYLQRQSDYATITVNLLPEALAKDGTGDDVWDPLKVAQEAWEASLRFWQGVASFLIRLVVLAWWVVPLGYVIFLLWKGRSRAPGQSA